MNYVHRHFTSAVAATVVLSVIVLYSLPAFASDNATAPKTLDEGIARLEKLLGSFKPKDARQFRMKVDDESELRSDPKKPAVLVVSRGVRIFGTPYRIGNAASFDVIESISKIVYRLGKDDKKEKVVRRQQRYVAQRITLRVDKTGIWSFDLTFLAHSIPSVIGLPYLTGSVEWLPKGVQLVGMGWDYMYDSEGQLVPVANQCKINLTREGDALVLADEWQNFRRVTSADGTVMSAPDFKKPIGKIGHWFKGKATLTVSDF